MNQISVEIDLYFFSQTCFQLSKKKIETLMKPCLISTAPTIWW